MYLKDSNDLVVWMFRGRKPEGADMKIEQVGDGGWTTLSKWVHLCS